MGRICATLGGACFAVSLAAGLAIPGSAVSAPLPAAKYYQGTAKTTCYGSAALYCYVTLPAVPADKVLTVASVDCSATVVASTGTPFVASAGISSPEDPVIAMKPELTYADAQKRFYVIHHDGDFFVSPGRAPSAYMITQGTLKQAELSCAVIGRLSVP
ncbi:hypothetical protein [Oharaeibacter diazotrophicus]|uniref:Uncharacterized protein n=1 Tax=Oharaeibacter diazotrophicus TaxID=1920512 RepID=A0A4V3CW41_9HYPH|nr:hypothetical protein [Oharaeibacter diazotrophicus]TDP84918.1 hypothetical protein EDD54_1760 [Oharaeibacter diazotrophicus]BBE73889.1 hypothetical protein OHA_1_03511 [Pleomorphomonas sp. SM30]GLS76426.1 hypothetical protein GCM10007904_17610 [Oharaeibacter diazotrophicus]